MLATAHSRAADVMGLKAACAAMKSTAVAETAAVEAAASEAAASVEATASKATASVEGAAASAAAVAAAASASLSGRHGADRCKRQGARYEKAMKCMFNRCTHDSCSFHSLTVLPLLAGRSRSVYRPVPT
jgi:hypothetical protein